MLKRMGQEVVAMSSLQTELLQKECHSTLVSWRSASSRHWLKRFALITSCTVASDIFRYENFVPVRAVEKKTNNELVVHLNLRSQIWSVEHSLTLVKTEQALEERLESYLSKSEKSPYQVGKSMHKKAQVFLFFTADLSIPAYVNVIADPSI